MDLLDQNVLNFFVSHRVDWLTFVMLIITYCGSYMVVSGLTLLSAISLFLHKHTSSILPLFLSVSGSAITTYILKHLISRPRPLEIFMMYSDNSPSFPSGHATAAMALYGFLFYIIWKYDKHFLRVPFLFFTTMMIILIGASRLYLGMHFLSDVLAGYTVGLVWIFLSIKFNKLKISTK